VSFFSSRSVRRALLDASPGHFTKDAVTELQTILEETVLKIVPDAREIASMAGKRRVTMHEIRLASKKYIK
jgi:histone H3/H4